jgi:hypothetical protein
MEEKRITSCRAQDDTFLRWSGLRFLNTFEGSLSTSPVSRVRTYSYRRVQAVLPAWNLSMSRSLAALG